MTCVEVRDSLTEHALGLLSADETADVERHLDQCPGCRKEAGELQEGVAAVAFALPPVDPPEGLEDRIVGRFNGFSAVRRRSEGGESVRTRHRVRALVAATLAALLLATGAVGWPNDTPRRAQPPAGSRTPSGSGS